MDIESVVVGTGPLASLIVLKAQEPGAGSAAPELPIQIGSFEASAISMGVAPREGGRPMTHDLLKSTISALGASCVSVRINDVKGTTFFAQVELMREDGRQVLVDARPSDAIALAVREEVKSIMRFWLDMGVDGFREDVITFISKTPGLPDAFPKLPAATGMSKYMNGPHIHDYLREYREAVEDYDCMLLGEGTRMKPEEALPYLESGELDLMFGFAHMEADCIMTDFIQRPFSLKKLKRAFSDWQEKLAGKAWNALYLENHDHPRVISRYGSERWRTESGKMLAACYMLQQGTPFVYQGQEIGMTNLRLPRLDMYVDVMLKNNCRIASKVLPQQAVLTMAQKSCRDSARTPMQWTGGPWAGFSETRPWFYVNENYRDVNVAVEEKDPDSLLNFYRGLIAFRKSEPLVMDGEYKEHLKQSPNFYVYSRESGDRRLLVICSFADKETYFTAPEGFDLLAGRLVLKNYEMNLVINNSFTARPYELRVYIFE